MKNRFFNQALKVASRIAGNPGRILRLLAQLAVKIYHTDLRKETIRNKISILGRMAGAFARGHYRNIPWKGMVSVLAALLYFINPVDLVPDFIPGLGLADDFTILVWVFNSLNTEIEKFLAWEKALMTSNVATPAVI